MTKKTLNYVIAAAIFSLADVLNPSHAADAVDPNLKVTISRINQNVVLSWPGSNAVTYQVESSTNFVWTNASLVLTGASGPLRFTNPVNASRRFFYRVKKSVVISAVFNPGTGILTVTGNELDNTIIISANAGTILVNNGAVPITGGVATITNTVLVEVFGRAGNDQLTMDQSVGTIPAHLFGEEGADTLTGSFAADQLFGGPGADTLIGSRSNDLLDGGADDDTFIWNPGDASDTVEGQTGNDTLVFNGSNANEKIDLSANGSRLRLTRDVAAITMDVSGVETVTLNALGGADTLTVNSLAGTGVSLVNAELATTGGIDDGAADVVVLAGTIGPDTFNFVANAGAVDASGSGALIRVHDAANSNDTISITGVGNDLININGSAGADTMTVIANGTVAQASTTGFPLPVSVSGALTLTINGLAGADNITCSGNLAPIVPLVLDGGDDNDTINGSNGADTILGGNGDDILDGNQGTDTVFGGADDDTFRWDPGDGSDILEGQTGTDTLVFNGANINEKYDLSANGSRLRLTRDVANIVMDVNGVETVTLNVLGGADTLTVNSLAGTGVSLVNAELAASVGGSTGDAQADMVIMNGTAGVDAFNLTASAGAVNISGITPSVHITHSEVANDSLTLNGLGGTDTFNIGAGVSSLIAVITNQ